MAKQTNEPSGSFLGGGPKFNRAGENAPLPGETVADAPPPQVFGGPKVWAGVLVIIVAAVILFLVWNHMQPSDSDKHSRAIQTMPSDDPDKSPQSP